jgi:hypothetical protein
MSAKVLTCLCLKRLEHIAQLVTPHPAWEMLSETFGNSPISSLIPTLSTWCSRVVLPTISKTLVDGLTWKTGSINPQVCGTSLTLNGTCCDSNKDPASIARLDAHNKWMMMSDSFDRASTVGFRCVKDH